MTGFITNRIKSVTYAIKGIILLVTTETNLKIQAFAGVAVTIAGFVFHLTTTEWILQTLTIALVMATEGINTAIEKLADFIHPEHHTKIGFIKDIAAGAVLITALAALIIGCLIYIPKFL